ncbi:hypothetical protein [Frankia sp. EAN1pec]|uniref:hypothetical protein n=1 Tax=Parafrankia sp. (strain EAN1pec) TaxID=298653 RepID=UPI0002F58645
MSASQAQRIRPERPRHDPRPAHGRGPVIVRSDPPAKVDGSPQPTEAVAAPATPVVGWRRLWAAALLAGFVTVAAIQPPREARPPTQPPWVDVVSAGALVLLAAAFVALLADHRWGFTLAVYGSAGFLLVSAVCPAWNHHQAGTSWIGQTGVATAMLLGSLVGRERTGSAGRAGPLRSAGIR